MSAFRTGWPARCSARCASRLLAVLIVLVFDRIIPAGREPAFLAGSKLRPVLSQASRQGLRMLPPDVAAYIDRLKRERGI